jgi:hypothetical protein
LEKFGNTLLSPFSNGKVKLIIVMVVFPVILNALNFWIIDNILKFKPEQDEEGEMVASMYEKENRTKIDINQNVGISNSKDIAAN